MDNEFPVYSFQPCGSRQFKNQDPPWEALPELSIEAPSAGASLSTSQQITRIGNRSSYRNWGCQSSPQFLYLSSHAPLSLFCCFELSQYTYTDNPSRSNQEVSPVTSAIEFASIPSKDVIQAHLRSIHNLILETGSTLPLTLSFRSDRPLTTAEHDHRRSL
ncbi:hypothetical protein BDW59DRAFT_15139 [Aspergillus cavernicola]|uniref:Uncharacterized protein n=1 Tax=Aspergillus cavernicola TaxID=176166 RepID=A0ABR4HJH1_9EURO